MRTNLQNEMEFIVQKNTYGATDIIFNEKPNMTIIQLLKSKGFKWFAKNNAWSSFKYTVEQAQALLNGDTVELAKTTNENVIIEREHDFKVGDILELSFGYDETHYCFFVITELIGKKSVRIKEVYPKLIESNYISSMSADRRYSTTEYEIKQRSIWIDDNNKGAIKQISNYYKDENGKATAINGWHHHTLFKYDGGKCYESWYA